MGLLSLCSRLRRPRGPIRSREYLRLELASVLGRIDPGCIKWVDAVTDSLDLVMSLMHIVEMPKEDAVQAFSKLWDVWEARLEKKGETNGVEAGTT